jgi:Flp pilus assembly protein TadD
MTSFIGSSAHLRSVTLRICCGAGIALLAAACAQDGQTGVSAHLTPPAETGSAAATGTSTPAPPTALPAPAAVDAPAAPELTESRRKRAAGDKAGALATLDRAAEKGAKDPSVQKERGLLALDLGQTRKAEQILKPLAAAKPADWRVLSGLGAALAAQGRQSEAQQQFAKALEASPDNPAVLNNLALSYALDGKSDDAERLLGRVASSKQHAARAKQNLALLAGLGGRLAEAERHASGALAQSEVRANLALLANGEGGGAAAAAPAEPAGKSRPERSAAAPTWTDSVLRLGGPRE